MEVYKSALENLGVRNTIKYIAEILEQRGLLSDPIRAMKSRHNLHKINYERMYFIAGDAITMNRENNQRGRGCFRNLYNIMTKELFAIAEEKDNGNYKIIYNFKKNGREFRTINE